MIEYLLEWVYYFQPAMTDDLAMINSTYSTNLLGYNFGSVIHSAYDM